MGKTVLPSWAFGRQISFVLDVRAFPKNNNGDQIRRASMWRTFNTGTKGTLIQDETCCNRFEHLPVDDCCAQRAIIALRFYENMHYKTSKALSYPLSNPFERTTH